MWWGLKVGERDKVKDNFLLGTLGKQCPYLGRVTHGRVGVWERGGRLGAESLLFALSLQST